MATATDSNCARCQVQQPPFTAAVAPLKYEFPVDTAIKSLKFRRNLYYLPVFGDMLLREMLQQLDDVDSLVPVPLHRWRQASRGFNQALELGKFISHRSGLPLVQNITRRRPTKTQSGLTAEQRKRNLHGAFMVSGHLRTRNPLIIDDVMTTGETCGQLAMTLLSSGAERVYVLAIARAQHPG